MYVLHGVMSISAIHNEGQTEGILTLEMYFIEDPAPLNFLKESLRTSLEEQNEITLKGKSQRMNRSSLLELVCML